MDKFYTATRSADDWGIMVAKPDLQWKSGYSARSLAYSWETAKGFPPEVRSLFASSGIEAFSPMDMIFAIPEYKVIMPPRKGHPSQNDLFVLAKGSDGNLLSISVEGKVSEKFGDTIGQWKTHLTPGKSLRLKFLLNTLGLPDDGLSDIRYQLFHRLASAVIEAKRFNAKYAAMIVHSFNQEDLWFDEFASFLTLFGVKALPEKLYHIADLDGVAVYSGWVRGDKKFLSY